MGINFHNALDFSQLSIYFITAIVVLWIAFARGLIVRDFFPNTNQNLTKITWAHAVNNQSLLNETFANDGINMIEADIVLGRLINTTEVIPIMCHPPGNESDLSLEGFLQQVENFNGDASDAARKGVKLDFKTIEVFNEAVNIVAKFDNGSYPIWVNADILNGPINATTLPVEAKAFLNGAKQFPNSILSIGWTTAYGPDSSGSYDADQISSMISTIRENEVEQNITFPVRAGLAAESRDLLVNLTTEIANSTLTIWSSEKDNVNIENLRQLIKEIGINKTYIDVPSDLLEQLHLDNLPNNSSSKSSLVFAVYIVTLIIGLRSVFQNFFDI